MERSNTHPYTQDELVQNHICNECGVERVVDDEDNICQTCYHKSCDEGECYCCYGDDEEDEEELCKNCDATYTGRKEPFCIMGHKNCEKGLPHITTLCDEDEDDEEDEDEEDDWCECCFCSTELTHEPSKMVGDDCVCIDCYNEWKETHDSEEDEEEEEEEEEECADASRCEECTHCARTKVCGSCGCVGGCYNHCTDSS